MAPTLGGGTQDTDLNKGFTIGILYLYIYIYIYIYDFGKKKPYEGIKMSVAKTVRTS